MSTVFEGTALAALIARYRQVYTGAVADVLDQRGLTHQIVDGSIQGLTLDMRVVGPAFTCKGAPATALEPDDWDQRKAFLDALTPQCVAVVDSSGDTNAAHWGELMSTAARGRGCTGVVIDGATRDVPQMLEMGFPAFVRYRSPASSIRRWRISGFGHSVTLGGVLVRQGDFVMGDADGVVVIPIEHVEPVIDTVEALLGAENSMRAELSAGALFSTTWDRYRVG